jgi:hypothetical protein
LKLFFTLGEGNPFEAVPGFELLAEGDGPRLGARIQEKSRRRVYI